MVFCLLELQAPVIHGFDNMTVNQDTKRKLRVFCNVSGNPHPKVTWTHNENVVVAQHTIDDINRCSSMVSGIYLKTGQDDTLIICDLNFQEHSGLYECSAKNKVDVVTETIHLTIEGKSVFRRFISSFFFFFFSVLPVFQ